MAFDLIASGRFATRDLLIKAVTVGLWVLVGVGSTQSLGVQAPPDSGWSRLRYRTGWILLGDVDVETQTWATTTRHVVKGSPPGHASTVPAVGDVLEITGPLQVVILDYKKRGETNRLRSPVGRRITDDDLTGVHLKPGMAVVVREIRHDQIVPWLQGVWARVVPAK